MFFADSISGRNATRGGVSADRRVRKSVGWRIDYQIATPGIAGLARATDIYAQEKFFRPCAALGRLRYFGGLTGILQMRLDDLLFTQGFGTRYDCRHIVLSGAIFD